MLLTQIVFQIQTWKKKVLLNRVVPFRTTFIHIIVYLNIYIIIFHSYIYNPPGSKLVSSFRISGMNIFRDRILIDVLLNGKPSGRKIRLIIIVVERKIVE